MALTGISSALRKTNFQRNIDLKYPNCIFLSINLHGISILNNCLNLVNSKRASFFHTAISINNDEEEKFFRKYFWLVLKKPQNSFQTMIWQISLIKLIIRVNPS